jgi:hypothetical protein
MYVQRNVGARSHNHCCSGKAISITYCECVFVALVVKNAMRMRHIVICGLPRSTIFFHVISQKAGFSKKKKVIEHKQCVLISSTTFVWNISHSKKKCANYDPKCLLVSMYSALPSFLSDFSETWIFSTVCRKILNYQFSWKSVWRQPGYSMRREGQTDRHDEANSSFSQFCENAQQEMLKKDQLNIDCPQQVVTQKPYH